MIKNIMLKQILELILNLFGVKSKNINKKPPLNDKKSQKTAKNTLKVKNNNTRLTAELGQLQTKNVELYKLATDLSRWICQKFNKNTLLTMIWRAQAEQDYLYRNSKKYKKKKFKSPHQFWQALDLRSRVYSKDEIDEIVEYLNKKYNSANYYDWTAKAHVVGNGAFHLHIQFLLQP